MPHSHTRLFSNTDLYKRLMVELPVKEADKLPLDSEVESLTKNVELLDVALTNIGLMHAARVGFGSYIEHIGKNNVDHFKTDNIKIAEIIGDMRKHPDLIKGYQLFKKILDDLEAVKICFNEKPSSDRADFMRLYQFHKQRYENSYKTISKTIDQWKTYYQFVNDVIDICKKIPGLVPRAETTGADYVMRSKQP